MEHDATLAPPLEPLVAADPASAPAQEAASESPPPTETPPPNGETADQHAAGTAQASVESALEALISEMHELRRDFESKVKYDASKERQLNLMHEELQAHREGFHFRIVRPILLELISLYNDLSKLIESSADNALLTVRDTVEEILRRHGTEPFAVEGDAASASRRRVVKVIPTADPDLDAKVARRVRLGFAYDDRVLQPEWVEAYRYAPSQNQVPATEDPTRE